MSNGYSFGLRIVSESIGKYYTSLETVWWFPLRLHFERWDPRKARTTQLPIPSANAFGIAFLRMLYEPLTSLLINWSPNRNALMVSSLAIGHTNCSDSAICEVQQASETHSCRQSITLFYCRFNCLTTFTSRTISTFLYLLNRIGGSPHPQSSDGVGKDSRSIKGVQHPLNWQFSY